MKIEKLMENTGSIKMFMKINELIDAHNANQTEQPKDMTFEEALVHYRSGKKIGRSTWSKDCYFNENSEDLFEVFDLNANNWRVIE